MSDKYSIRDLKLKSKKVLMRVDYNVPIDSQGMITDDSRIKTSLPSIHYLLENNASIILMSHMGRPKGKRHLKLSLKVCADHLSKLIKLPVKMATDCVGKEVQQMAKDLKLGEILLLENLRFHPAEETPEKNPAFAKELASLAEFYINDAFGTAHRSHSSNVEICKYFLKKSAFGFLIEKEINFLGNSLLNPGRPFYALVGGAKISSKIGVIKALINKTNGILIGGGMAFTFLRAKNIPIGKSIVENDQIKLAKEIIQICKDSNVELILPLDLVVADKFDNEANYKTILTQEGVPDDYMGLDIGPKTLSKFAEILKNAHTIIWNGPMGAFEMPRFAKGTFKITEILASLESITIVGGGDSIAAINASGLSHHFSHISTGGGASLEYIEFGRLPGIEALANSTSN